MVFDVQAGSLAGTPTSTVGGDQPSASPFLGDVGKTVDSTNSEVSSFRDSPLDHATRGP